MTTPTQPTLEQLSQMTDEELNVRLAELCGLKPWLECRTHGEVTPDQAVHYTKGPYCPWCGNDLYPRELPRYCTDANAVAEVRKGLSQDQQEWVCGTLYWLVIPEEDHFPDHFISWSHMAKLCNASPRQITIAIIKTLAP